MEMDVTCHPPLGFVTSFDGPKVTFAVGVSLNDETVTNWEFSIWHNNDDREWGDLSLVLLEEVSNKGRYFYRGTIERHDHQIKSFQFTLRFRNGYGPWQWIRDESGLGNGEVVFESSTRPSNEIGYYMSNLDTNFAMRSLESRDPSCVACWELNRRVPAACGSESGWERTAVGIPTSVLRWFALVRQNEHWFGPRQGSGPLSLDKDALLLSFLRSDGQHLVLVAVSGFDDITGIFRADEKGHIVLISRNDREEIGIAHVFAAVGPTWHSAVEAAMEATKDYAHRRTAQQDQGTGSIAAPISEKERDLASWYDGFTYCTWNGLGQHLTPAKILKSLDLLKANDIDISNLIIDDNWQSLDFSGADNFYHRWTDFEANPENFPGGLKSLISDIRRRNPGIIDIAVWHGIFGYWGGMSPDNGKLARDYFMRTFNRQEGIFLGDGTMATVDGADVGRLYDEFYRFLAKCGVTAVKTDTQSFLNYPQNADDRCNLTRVYQDAWRAAMLKHFHGKSIACMAQIPQTIFYSMIRSDMPKILMRNSDDFFPDEPSSHTWHVFCNAHNAILAEHLNVLPDWDMFQTDHIYSSFHAAARCLSAGPIYITDIPGRHDVSLIQQMTAKSLQGRSIILRPEKMGRTSDVYVTHSEARLLRIETTHQGASVLGLFNMGSSSLREMIGLSEFPGRADGTRYVVRYYSSGTYSGPWSTGDDLPFTEVEVARRGFEILTAYPVRTYGTLDVAVLGLLGKMSGAAAILSLSYQEYSASNQVEIRVRLRALGLLGIYLSNERLDIDAVKFSVHGRTLTASRHTKVQKNTLILDMSSAWAEFMELAGDLNSAVKELNCCVTIPSKLPRHG